ncbi:MAG TPA: undecaprenyldiphospho-muramoylpentapeptide beta-N-acetylglucosaminyltransferase [Candidatus Omnitrophota bacterium]|nr:undecaprenyldiphospho-muramoylpentapeptide beta-N-acetylglucosaminyltransferase [Candidatus Omnitrophota bacterium]HPN57263.1 undecaprenyldiphospho-muramoylpentapeptide beta-N-acetylglucosaminyltransferase [Candidatus Omnitrophota bacterium]
MTFVFAISGSGGHILPALKVAEQVSGLGHRVVFMGDFRGFASLVDRKGIQCYPLDVRGLSGRSLKSLGMCFFKMILAFGTAVRLLKELRPAVVTGFGGYGSVPVLLAAVFWRVPTLIHEQNVRPGRATKILSRLVTKVALSFEETGGYLSPATVVTGCPGHVPREDYNKNQIIKSFNLQEGAFTILVLGGSQGSQAINSCWLESVLPLKERMDFQVIHLTGHKNYDLVKGEYQRMRLRSRVMPFLEDMALAYSVADMAISRAGAVSVTELSLFGLPAILIPYPHAGGHQKENARILVNRGLGIMIEESRVSPEALIAAVEKIKGPGSRYGRRAPELGHDAARLLSDEILKLTARKSACKKKESCRT